LIPILSATVLLVSSTTMAAGPQVPIQGDEPSRKPHLGIPPIDDFMVTHMGVVNTMAEHDELADTRATAVREYRADGVGDGKPDGWFVIDMNSREYWTVGEPLASELTRRREEAIADSEWRAEVEAQEAEIAAMSPEDQYALYERLMEEGNARLREHLEEKERAKKAAEQAADAEA